MNDKVFRTDVKNKINIDMEMKNLKEKTKKKEKEPKVDMQSMKILLVLFLIIVISIIINNLALFYISAGFFIMLFVFDFAIWLTTGKFGLIKGVNVFPLSEEEEIYWRKVDTDPCHPASTLWDDDND